MNKKENASLRLPLQRENVWKSEASSKQLRLDSIPPNGGSGIDPAKKLELPPTKKDELKAPSKKSGSTIKKEKPKQSPAKIKGAELWGDCPPEFLRASSTSLGARAKTGMVSARVSIPGPGFVLKEAGIQGGLFITEEPEASEKIDSAPSSTSLDPSATLRAGKLPSTPLPRLRSGQVGTGRDKSLGTRKNSSSTDSKSNRTSPKPKGKSK